MAQDSETLLTVLRSAKLTSVQRAHLARRRPALTHSLDESRRAGVFANHIGEQSPDEAPG